MKVKQVYDDLGYLRSVQLNDLPLEIIRDMGTNFFEMKVREISARIAEENDPNKGDKKDRAYILGLEKLLLSAKIESLKLQGAYQDPEGPPAGPIQIIFKGVGPDYGKNSAEQKALRAEEEEARGQDDQ